jgi:hypothetical protein
MPPWEHHELFGQTDEDFPNRVGSLIEQLRKRLGAGPDLLDLTVESGARLDSLIENLYQRDIPVDILPEILAYVGEVMIRHYGCRWHMTLDPHFGKVWEPWIEMPSGKSSPVHRRLSDSIEEEGRGGAQFALYTMILVDMKEV